MKAEEAPGCVGVLGWLMVAVPLSRKRTKTATVEADRLWIPDVPRHKDDNSSCSKIVSEDHLWVGRQEPELRHQEHQSG